MKLNTNLEVEYELIINNGEMDECYSNTVELENGTIAIITNTRFFDPRIGKSYSSIHLIDNKGEVKSNSILPLLDRTFITKMGDSPFILGTKPKPIPFLDRSSRNRRYELFFSKVLEKDSLPGKTPLYFAFLESTRNLYSALSLNDSQVVVFTSPNISDHCRVLLS